MASPLIIRKGEGKKTVMIGPDSWLFRITGADVDGRFDLMEATITHLQGPPLHLHYEQDDTFFVIEGTLTEQVGDELFELKAGDVVCAPKGVPHTFANVGERTGACHQHHDAGRFRPSYGRLCVAARGPARSEGFRGVRTKA